MFKITHTDQSTYGEVSQPNPLRWRIMHRSKDTLTDQSGLIKCKDFFNDVVAYRKAGREFSMYGFKNKVKFNRYGLYLHLTNVHDNELFLKNMAVLNQRLKADLNIQIKVTDQNKGSVVLHVPNKLWDTTWHISLVSMLIRCCNYKNEFTTWDDFFTPDAPLNTIEKAFSPQAKINAQTIGFKLPKNMQGFWFWGGDKCNSKTHPDISTGTIHNNGVSNWSVFFKV